MKRNTKRAAALLLATLAAACTFGCEQKESAEQCPVAMPSYSETNYRFSFEGGVNDGWITHGDNNEKLYIEEQNMLNEADLRAFKEMGNDVLKLGRGAVPFGTDEAWATSATKRTGDLAYSVGLDKIYIADEAFLNYMQKSYKLVGEEASSPFKTVAELDAFVTARLQLYIAEPWLYGVDLRDEPSYTETDNIGALAASIYRCAKNLGYPNFRVHVNLHPHKANVASSLFAAEYENARDAYTQYIENYVVKMETPQMCVDHYLFLPEGSDWGYYATLQTLREVCTKYDIEMQFYAHSFSEYKSGKQRFRDIGEAELYHELNSIIGMGTQNINWFRYAPYPSGYNSEGYGYDRGYFVDRYGNPNDLYYYGKKIIAEFQSFANVLLNYEYKGGKFYRAEGVSLFDVDQLTTNALDTKTLTRNEWDNSHEFTRVKGVEMDNEMAFLTEFYDETNDLYLYMVMNPIDPYYTAYGDTTEEICVDFGTEYEWVAEYDCGRLSYVKLDGGKYETTLSAGYATYVVPLK